MSGYNTLEGVYYIINKASGTMIDLPGMDNPSTSSKAVGWSLGLIKPGLYDHQHWLIRQDGQGQTFTIQNIGNGKMLELAKGSNSNGLQATCSPRDLKNDRVRTSQEWLLKEQNGGWYILQNSKSRTVLEIASGSSANRAAVQGWDYNQVKEEQLWHLERRSRTPAEIVNILCNTPPFRSNGEGIQRINVVPPGKPIEYVTLLDGFRTQIFLEAGLFGQGLAQRGYDQHMDFAEKTQEAIATKGGQRIRVPGVAVLIGIVEGNVAGEQDTRVYNWYLTQDLCTVVFLDARTGREYTARGLDLEGFQPTKVYY